MEEFKKCCFIGHRKVENQNEVYEQALKAIEDLIINYGVTTFLFGSRSEFNDLCLKAVGELKKQYPQIFRIAYTCKSESCTLETEKEIKERLYSFALKKEVKLDTVDEEFHFKNKSVAGKASYVERNYAMIDESDYCIFYYNENYTPPKKNSYRVFSGKSGTEIAFNYATQRKKKIINLFLSTKSCV